MKKIIFFIIVLGIGLGLVGFWYWQRNPYSKEILKLEVLGPEEAVVGQEVEYIVKYKNNGNVRLEEPRLIFEFPENTIGGEGFSKRKELGPEDLGDIYPGEEKSFQFKGRLLGKEGEIKTAKVWLSYQPKNLQARYESATTFSTIIKSTILTFEFDLSSKIEAARDFKFSLNYFSSLDYPLINLGVKIEYPSGFEFLESSPRSLEKTEWEIPLLNKAEGGRIDIKGRLSGEVKEQKIFKAVFGIWLEDEFISLKEISKGIEIVKPRLSIFQQINGQSQYIANPGEMLHYEIYFRNIGDEAFRDLFLVAQLEGKALDFETVRTDLGKFNKGDSSIIWDWRDVPELRFLDRGEEGKVEFWIELKKEWQSSDPQEKNAFLRSIVLLSQVKEEFETKVNSKLVIEQEAISENGIYTVNWRARNYFNDVRNVKVKAVLPENVSLTGRVMPEEQSSKFSFDNQSREIIWMIGDMEAGQGVSNEPPKISFQVSLKSGQIIINEATIIGEDQWTEIIIEGKAPEITH